MLQIIFFLNILFTTVARSPRHVRRAGEEVERDGGESAGRGAGGEEAAGGHGEDGEQGVDTRSAVL